MVHVLSAGQFAKDAIERLCASATAFQAAIDAGRTIDIGHGKILANLFYEPSTRTSSSFYSAMIRLGGNVIPINNVQYSSVAKGESLEDTIRTMACYVDGIVLRHPERGAAERAASVASVPIINAGDGDNEHPTQALLDFYTIWQELDNLKTGGHLHVIMMGDLKRGRTVKSLAKLLRLYGVRISWVAPPELEMPFSRARLLKSDPSVADDIRYEYVQPGEIETSDLSAVLPWADVLYLTRAQIERGGVSGNHVYGLTPEHMKKARTSMLLMHPLPRQAELPVELDSDPRAIYFRQMRYGLFMRMAVLAEVMQLSKQFEQHNNPC